MRAPYPDFSIETARLILRPPVAKDFDGWAAYDACPVTKRFVGGVLARSASWRTFCTMAGAWALYSFGMFSVIEKSSGRWIGRLGAWQPEGWPGTEVGWGLILDATGKGYAIEGACAAMDWVFDRLGWADAIHCIAPENLSSQKVALALGSRNRGPGKLPAPYEASTIEIWGQTREEWQARRKSVAST